MDRNIQVKQENLEPNWRHNPIPNRVPLSIIDLSSSDSDSDADVSSSSGDDDAGVSNKRPRISDGVAKNRKKKKKRVNEPSVVLPLGFLDPLPAVERSPLSSPAQLALVLAEQNENGLGNSRSACKQFWKAGDYDEEPESYWESSTGGMDHVRVHPRFLHSNATSHKWVLGAFAELLDNALDEVCNGATYVNIDMIRNKKDGNRMLMIEDNGGGMDPDKMRQCMSLGYSLKSKLADTIGQYGNGFKTSTMRLGADVIVFSRSRGKSGKSPTQSIGLLSYTFLRSTGKEDIVVPMLDYEMRGKKWTKIIRSSAGDWNMNVDTVVRWSPFSSEDDLLGQFNHMKDQGTRIIIYNLWEDDQGLLELDFDADPHDIQIRGVNRDERNIQMAQQYPNSKHFLTYRHSLRSYASILYLRVPPHFRIILRGEDVEHHNIVNDMMLTEEVTYRPQSSTDGVPKDSNMIAAVTMGFVKDAKSHIDVQGFNVYHKNRLIKPFWRLWHAPGSDGRGVIGVLEANFVEPAHDKQGFERTTVLSRLETRLVQMQKTYWYTHCQRIGYAPRRNKKSAEREVSPDDPSQSPRSKETTTGKSGGILHNNEQVNGRGNLRSKASSVRRPSSSDQSSPSFEDASDEDVQIRTTKNQANGHSQKLTPARKSSGNDASRSKFSPISIQKVVEQNSSPGRRPAQGTRNAETRVNFSQPILKDREMRPSSHNVEGNKNGNSVSDSCTLDQLKEENRQLRQRLNRKEEEILGDLLRDLQTEKGRCRSLETQVAEAKQKIDEMNKEQETLIDIFSEERQRRDIEEENLRKKLKDASNTIQELVDKVRLLEKIRASNGKL